MGCCGCDNKTSTSWGTVIAILQCVAAVIITCYNLNVYFATNLSPEQAYLRAITLEYQSTIRAMLFLNLFVHILWAASSVLGAMGNQKDNALRIRQWVRVTVFVIICDVVLPAVVIGVTFSTYTSAFISSSSTSSSFSLDEPIQPSELLNLKGNYLLLAASFGPGGIIIWIANICFCKFASVRVREILHPGYVVSGPGGAVMVVPAGGVLVQSQGPVYHQFPGHPQQSFGPPQPQYGPPQPQYFPPNQQPSFAPPQHPGYFQGQQPPAYSPVEPK